MVLIKKVMDNGYDLHYLSNYLYVIGMSFFTYKKGKGDRYAFHYSSRK